MARHIGIAACSAEGAALCYRTICAEAAALMGTHNHPEISMHTPSFVRHVQYIRAGDWQGVADLLVESAGKLAGMGAEFLICPDNTVHKAMPMVYRRSPLPWLHIAEEVAREAERKGYRKVGLTGTKALVESDVYPEKLGACAIDYLRPEPEEREHIDRIIFDELVCGELKPESLGYFQKVISRMQASGCDAVALGCTEIPLLVSPDNSPLPTLDSTRLLARAALARSVRG
jgi:aspartate racemase